MDPKITFIYDGECPFCSQFAELLELKSNLPNLSVKNARNKPHEIPPGYDIDIKGAILLIDGEFFSGSNAINRICSYIKDPSDRLLGVLTFIFRSQQRTNYFFPFLLLARRVLLFIRGVPRKIF